MKTLKYTNGNKAIDVEYLVDLIGDNDMLTVYQASQYIDGVKRLGLTSAAIAFGMLDEQDQKVTQTGTNPPVFTKFTLTYAKWLAKQLNLTLEAYEDRQNKVTLNALDALEVTTKAIDAGVGGNAQVETLTFPNTAGAVQGDYVVLTNAFTGETLAAWIDIEANGTEPTGAIYDAADIKVVIPIVAEGTSANTAAAFVLAIADLDWLDEITVVDNEDGTVTVTQNYTGVIDEAVLKNADDSGIATITSVTGIEGTAGKAYEFEFEATGGNSPYIWTTESTLPAGITLSESGVLSGTPIETGTFPLVIKVTDFFGVEDTLEADLVIGE